MMERGGGELAVPQEVGVLLEERSKVRGWLEKLEGLEDEVSAAVYEKVRADYRTRLGEVNGRLTAHRDGIEKAVDEGRSRLATLEEERRSRAIQLEEMEIRFRVGEYTEEEWEGHREEHEGVLQGMDSRIEEARATLSRLEDIRNQVTAAAEDTVEGPGPEPWEPAASRPGEDRTAEPAAVAPEEGPQVASEPPGEEGEADGEGGDGEEGEEAPLAVSGRTRGAPEGGEGVGDDDRDSEFLDELEFLESLSIEEPDRFDAVSLGLEEEETGAAPPEDRRER